MQSCRFQLAEATTLEELASLPIVDRQEQALVMFVLVPSEALSFPISWNPIDCTVDVAISNDLIVPSKPPVMIDAVSDVDEPTPTANDNSGPDSMLCVSNNRLLDGFSLDVSWTRIAPSQLVEAKSLFVPSSEDEGGRYCSADIPSGNLSKSLASGGGCEAISSVEF